MTIDNKIRDEKVQYKINKEAVKISTLLSQKIDKYEHVTDEELKQVEGIFLKKLLNDLIVNELWQDVIKADQLYYKSSRKKTYHFGKYYLPIVF